MGWQEIYEMDMIDLWLMDNPRYSEDNRQLIIEALEEYNEYKKVHNTIWKV